MLSPLKLIRVWMDFPSQQWLVCSYHLNTRHMTNKTMLLYCFLCIFSHRHMSSYSKFLLHVWTPCKSHKSVTVHCVDLVTKTFINSWHRHYTQFPGDAKSALYSSGRPVTSPDNVFHPRCDVQEHALSREIQEGYKHVYELPKYSYNRVFRNEAFSSES